MGDSAPLTEAVITKSYQQKTIKERMEQLFLDNLGKIVTREQIIAVATDPRTGKVPENWHQRLSELRTDNGYTIQTSRDRKDLKVSQYLMPHTEKRSGSGRRVKPTNKCWLEVLQHANNRCQWNNDGVVCGLVNGEIDPVGGGTVVLTADHMTPHSINASVDADDPSKWQALCGRHQVMKKNFWDSNTGKVNVMAILQSITKKEKRAVLDFLSDYFNEAKK